MPDPPPVLVDLGPGRVGWLSPDLSTLRFRLRVEPDGPRPRRRGQGGVTEVLSVAELQSRFPRAAAAVAAVVAAEIRPAPPGPAGVVPNPER